MPTKKKSGKKSGKKKKKTVAKSGDSFCEDATPEDPSTAVSGEAPKPKSAGKKKKKAKKRMTKSEKALAKLDKEAEKMRSSSQVFNKFVSRMDRWLTVYYPRAIELFRRFDVDGDGLLTYEEFKSGMYDLNAPCTAVELHLLARLLDAEEEEQIDYTQFTKGLQAIRGKEQSRRDAEERRSVLILSERTVEPCACCKLGLWHPYTEKYPKFVQVEMRLVTFDNFEDHPAHFTVVVHAHSPVGSLVRLVAEQTDIQSTTITVFSDPSRSRQAALPADKTLEEVGFPGGSFDDPEDVTLFYDYTVEFTDCPLLLCDHYFGQKL